MLTELDTLGVSELQPLGPERRRILGNLRVVNF
jgi:hypothetical protein